MVRILTLIAGLIIYLSQSYAQQFIPPIGQWRDHLPYKSAIDLTAGNGKVFAATPYSIFNVDMAENTVERMSRISGLNETGVSGICFDQSNDKLLVAYQNSNLDIIYRNDIFNIPDLKRANIAGDKTIYNVFALYKKFYLSTGLGVIVIDAEKYEIKDSWFIGNNGNPVNVSGFTADNLFFYAATAEGLKRTTVSIPDPANYLNWQNLSGINGLPAGRCDDVVAEAGKIFALIADSVFVFSNNSWTLFFSEPGWQVQSVNAASAKIIVCQRKTDGSAKITALNPDGTVMRIIQQPNTVVVPMQAVLFENNYWVADSIGGLTKFTSSGFENYKLNSPESVANGDLQIRNSVFYAASGGVDLNWQKQNNKNGIFSLTGGQWKNYNKSQYPRLDSMPDLISLAIDPRDESVWSGSFGGGLMRIKKDNSIEIFKQNSSIGQTLFDPGSYRVSGLVFDRDHHLWISNYGAAQNVLVRKADGNWKTFSVPFALVENAVAQILVDDENQKWIVSPKGNGLICFNDGNTIDNSGDDRWKLYKKGSGSGNLPSDFVNCVAKDKNGFVWVGTNDGIGIIQCPQNVFTAQGCEAVLPVVQQGGFNQFLFKGEVVTSIAVDGANRKWVATRNGAWLISADGERIIFRFTEENSLLLSNHVNRIAIDGKNGEVFFSTEKGICSFRSTATEGTEKNEDVLIFPNPVPPGFQGMIAIRGLVTDAIVKITELDGRLVYQTRALGGQAVWNGKDYTGRRISSGVYLVLVTDDSRKENLAGKIVFISK